MAIMQGGDTFFWFWIAALITVGLCVATWYFVIVGRDRSPRKQRRGEETVERYGNIEEDRAPIPKFLFWTYVGLALWAIGYVVWTGIGGIGI